MDSGREANVILTNHKSDMNFRATHARIKVDNDGVIVASDASSKLNLEIGHAVAYVPIRPQNPEHGQSRAEQYLSPPAVS